MRHRGSEQIVHHKMSGKIYIIISRVAATKRKFRCYVSRVENKGAAKAEKHRSRQQNIASIAGAGLTSSVVEPIAASRARASLESSTTG